MTATSTSACKYLLSGQFISHHACHRHDDVHSIWDYDYMRSYVFITTTTITIKSPNVFDLISPCFHAMNSHSHIMSFPWVARRCPGCCPKQLPLQHIWGRHIIKDSRSSYKNIKHTKDYYQPKNSEIKGIPIPMAFHHSDRFPRRRIYKAPFCLAIQRDSQRFTKSRLAQSSTRRPKLMTCTLTHSHSIRSPRGNAFAQVAFR